MKKLLVILLVLGLAAPAMAATPGWFWYGTARVHMGYIDNSKEFQSAVGGASVNGIPSMDTSIRDTGAPYGVSDSGLMLNITDTTRVGARVVASDALTAQFETSLYTMDTGSRLGGTEVMTTDGMMLRVLYGQYKFGIGNLRVGQDYTPASFLLYSNEIGDIGWGGDEIMTTHSIPYISRRPQIKLSLGGFQVALIEHNTTCSYTGIRALTASTDDEDFNLPRIELAYQFNTPVVSLRPILGYQTYSAVQRTGTGATAATATTETSETITSYVGGLGVNLRFGPAYVNLAGAYSQNPGNYGLYQPNQARTRFAGIGLARADGTFPIIDATSMSGILVAGFKINPMLTVEAGIGYLKSEGETSLYTGAVAKQKYEQASMNYYIQMPITIAPGFFITPEIGVLDMGDMDNTTTAADDKVKQGSSTWFSASFRMDF